MPTETKEQATASANQKKKTDDAKKDSDDSSRAALSATTELLFVILPFIVIAITLAHRDQFRTIVALPEWSIVSAVITGQAIVKFASMGFGRKVHREGVTLMLSALLVCLLVPVLIILAIALTSDKMSTSLEVSQGILFLLSSCVFWAATFLRRYLIPESD